MRIGSHNSWTFRRPDKWLARKLNFMTKCQEVDIPAQLETYKCCIFDLRLRMKDNKWYVAHGSTTYGLTPWDDLAYLNEQAANKRIQVRIILEYNSEPKDSKKIISQFKSECNKIVAACPNIGFFGGHAKWKWSLIAYDFGTPEPTFIDAYSSMADNNKLNDLYPEGWAKRNNKKYKAQYADTNETLLMDFVNIG